MNEGFFILGAHDRTKLVLQFGAAFCETSSNRHANCQQDLFVFGLTERCALVEPYWASVPGETKNKIKRGRPLTYPTLTT